MLIKLILLLAAAFASYLIFRTRNFFAGLITSGMIIGILLTLFLSGLVGYAGIYIYMGFVVLSFFYGLILKEPGMGSRIVICLMSASIFAYWLWVFNHWHGNVVFLPVITLITALVGILFRKRLKNEAGFLVILTADAIAIIIELLMKAN